MTLVPIISVQDKTAEINKLSVGKDSHGRLYIQVQASDGYEKFCSVNDFVNAVKEHGKYEAQLASIVATIVNFHDQDQAPALKIVDAVNILFFHSSDLSNTASQHKMDAEIAYKQVVNALEDLQTFQFEARIEPELLKQVQKASLTAQQAAEGALAKKNEAENLLSDLKELQAKSAGQPGSVNQDLQAMIEQAAQDVINAAKDAEAAASFASRTKTLSSTFELISQAEECQSTVKKLQNVYELDSEESPSEKLMPGLREFVRTLPEIVEMKDNWISEIKDLLMQQKEALQNKLDDLKQQNGTEAEKINNMLLGAQQFAVNSIEKVNKVLLPPEG